MSILRAHYSRITRPPSSRFDESVILSKINDFSDAQLFRDTEYTETDFLGIPSPSSMYLPNNAGVVEGPRPQGSDRDLYTEGVIYPVSDGDVLRVSVQLTLFVELARPKILLSLVLAGASDIDTSLVLASRTALPYRSTSIDNPWKSNFEFVTLIDSARLTNGVRVVFRSIAGVAQVYDIQYLITRQGVAV